MIAKRAHVTSLLLPLVAALAGCGGSSGSTASGPARMSVHLVDGPATDYQEVNLHVVKVEILGAQGWITLGTPDVTVNLLTLTGGVDETLADGATLAAGHYGELRLLLGAGNTVKLADGTVAPLTVPSGLQSGVKLPVSFDVAPGTTRDVFIDLDARRSVFVHAAGKSGKYILRPVVRAFDRAVTGSISGTLTTAPAEGAAQPIAGADVTAQVLGAGGEPDVVGSTKTGADGRYQLDLLPLAGGPYHVVSQPVAGGPAYVARASAAITLTEAAPVATFDAAFAAAAGAGGIAGAVSPVAGDTQDDVAFVRASLDAGGTPGTFVLRAVPAAVASGAETWTVTDLPAGGYTARVQRTTTDPVTMATSTAWGAVVTATVAAGGSVAVTLPAP